jgi:uncharacterized protein (DUF2235 family)
MKKRLVICCDGTWNTPERENVTNVAKVARAIRPTDSRAVEQVVFYDWGIGSGNRSNKMKGGLAGKGLDKNIQDAYRFLVHNYKAGDELFLFGFSRGAYTVRSLIGFIRNCGLLKKTHAHMIPDAFAVYRSSTKPDVPSTRSFRRKYSRDAEVKFLGVWDTVGALGIPLGIFARTNEKRYSFHDTKISSIVKNAYHALAIDEMRKPFAPVIWKTKPGRRNTGQAWFAGVHSDVGGGYVDSGLSDKALVWMVEKATACGLAMDMSYMESVLMVGSPETLHRSFKGSVRFAGKYVRSVGVTNRDEFVHDSALARYRSRKSYRPKNLCPPSTL